MVVVVVVVMAGDRSSKWERLSTTVIAMDDRRPHACPEPAAGPPVPRRPATTQSTGAPGPAGTAALADVPLRWVVVAPDEVGVLHRLARVVRGTPGGVLVRLDAVPAGATGAQVGVSPCACCGGAPTDLVWFGGMGAHDVGVVAAWIASGSVRVPAELSPRVVAVTGPGRGAAARAS
ncbi:hypothetical protein WDZ17_09680 [Pseudokineococcus basanitobsidens]|uniref:Uncharacterized protein n=1 Tax=Pseudokineococcus basanitobsidens TaxID=1926649 RepID=A0ABU8RKG6_9ACTN